MEVLPAIDLRDGKVVRLFQGDYARQTTYRDDPVAVAESFVQAGARWIHMVDLDAARSGESANLPVVRGVCGAVGARIQLGGGARTTQAIEEMLAAGVSRVVVGSAALADWAWFEGLLCRADLAGKLALGLDERAGRLAICGWTEQTPATAVEFARRTKGRPLGAIVYTDIARDGTLEGVNTQGTAEVVGATDVPVIASGGVGGLEDVLACERLGCAGLIVGRACYEGKIDLAQAIRLAARPEGGGAEGRRSPSG
jgi:phosphoribosylformimino-5-aminoimidazole carboxamide ribotide isomerase